MLRGNPGQGGIIATPTRHRFRGRGLQLVAIDSFDVPFASQHVVPPLVLDTPSGIRRGGSPGDWASEQRQSLSERFGS